MMIIMHIFVLVKLLNYEYCRFVELGKKKNAKMILIV